MRRGVAEYDDAMQARRLGRWPYPDSIPCPCTPEPMLDRQCTSQALSQSIRRGQRAHNRPKRRRALANIV